MTQITGANSEHRNSEIEQRARQREHDDVRRSSGLARHSP